MCPVAYHLIRAVFMLYMPTFKAYKVLGTLCLSRTCERMQILSSNLSSSDSGCLVLLSRLTLMPKVYCHRIAVPSVWRICCLIVFFFHGRFTWVVYEGGGGDHWEASMQIL